jgi:hypothetical protein
MGHIRVEAAYYFVLAHQHCVYGIKEQLLNFCPGENLKHLMSKQPEFFIDINLRRKTR